MVRFACGGISCRFSFVFRGVFSVRRDFVSFSFVFRANAHGVRHVSGRLAPFFTTSNEAVFCLAATTLFHFGVRSGFHDLICMFVC